MDTKVILASASQRRADILTNAGIKFDIKVSNVEEVHSPFMCPKELVLENSKLKAEKIALENKESLVIGTDTLVSIDGHVMGKPEEHLEAEEVFKKYCDSDAYVYTGITLIYKDRLVQGVEESLVKINKEIYFENKELIRRIFSPDKAGGFTIEGLGAIVFDNVRGSYFNILGFPMKLFYDLLKEIEINILELT